MKSKLTILSLAWLLAGSTVGLTQDNQTVGNDAPKTDQVAANNAPATDQPVANDAPKADQLAANDAPKADQPVANETPKAASAATSNAPHDPNEVIPLIVMDDVGLNDAIKNLARQANLNYILDPKVSYGMPGPDGKIVPQPTISIRWEKLTSQQALTAVLNNYNLMVIEDPKTQIARITVKDPTAPEPLISKIIQLKFANPTNIEATVKANLLEIDKRSKVLSDVRTSQLVVLSTEKGVQAADDIVEKLDTITKQVLIEAKLLETSRNPQTFKGIDWSGTLKEQKFTFGNNALPGTPPTTVTTIDANGNVNVVNDPGTVGGILMDPKILLSTDGGFQPSTAFLNADGVSAVLSFINSDSDAQVLSTPRVVTLDNQMALLSVTRAQPIFKNTAGTQGSPGGSEVTYTNLGTILKVTPRVSANDFINLKVVPEVSSVFATVRRIVASTVNEADVYDIRKFETQVLIPSGNTLVMGGLVSDNSNKAYTKVPVLGDLPLIGLAFRSESKLRAKKNLIIFITPTIVRDDDYQVAKSDYLKSKFEVEPEATPTAWDSGKPIDWSKPVGPGQPFQQNLKD